MSFSEGERSRTWSEDLMTNTTRSRPLTFEAAAIGTCQTDGAGRFLTVSEELCRILGYARDELINRLKKLRNYHSDSSSVPTSRQVEGF
jgi:PAS domain-containing protein